MLTAEASVATERAGRYLVQLCQHINAVAQSHPQMRAEVECSDHHGVIGFDWGRCILRAEPGALILRAHAGDEASLRTLQQGITSRLEQIGRRDGLSVTWSPPQGVPEVADPARHPGGDTHQGKTHMHD